jgi:multidrug efflux pump subunit AcrA (membrane-fusion protein)
VEGWLQEWFVQEGSRVAEGDPIVRITDNDPLLLERLQAEREAALARQQAAEQALATARSNVRRQQGLTAQGLSARKQLEEAQLKVADVLKELTAAQAELARLETRQARQSRQLVTAPRAGIILRRMAGEASVFVKPGDELAILVPEASERAVELWLDGNDVPLVRPGGEVRLQFEGWPALQFSGWPVLAVGTFNGEVSVVDAAQAGRAGHFRLLVTPAPGAQWPESPWLRQGVRAHGWVLLNEVPLGYELWRRFNAFPPEVPPPGDKQAPAGSASDKDGERKK